MPLKEEWKDERADAARQHGSLGQAETAAENSGKELLNAGVRKQEADHAEQDRRIERVAAIVPQDKR